MSSPFSNHRTFETLFEVVKTLRSPKGCPWDKKQTHNSLTKHAVEEVFELVDAIENGEDSDLAEELGDVLLQVLLHSEIARGENRFDVYDVIEKLNDKMIRRHPHVFAGAQADNAEEALENWNEVKQSEKNQLARTDFGLPSALPSLQMAEKIGSKTKAEAFDWNHPDEVFEKIKEEEAELKDAIQSGEPAAIEHEIGDMLFSLAQLARHLKVDPEKALRKTNKRFETRFFKMKSLLGDQKDFKALTLQEKETLWQEAKRSLKK